MLQSSKSVRLALLSLASFLFYLANYLTGWPLLRYWNKSSGVFGDSKDILHSAECFKKFGTGIYTVNASETGCGYWYGSNLLRFLNLLGLNTSFVKYFGFLFIALLVTALGFFINSSQLTNLKVYLIQMILLISPPFMLLAQRANFDSLIFFLITLSVYFVYRSNFVIAILLVCLTALMKFYTAPLLLFFVIFSPKVRDRYLAGAIFVLTLTLIIPDLLKSPVSKPGLTYIGDSFGLGTLSGAINLTQSFSINSSLAHVIDLIIFCFILILVAVIINRQGFLKKLEEVGPREVIAFLIFAGAFLVSFMVTSVDYRLIYIGPALFLLRDQITNVKNWVGGSLLLFYSSFLLSYPSGRINIFGDLSNFILAAFFLVIVLNLVSRKLLTYSK